MKGYGRGACVSRLAAVVASCLMLSALAGCLSPLRVQVPDDILDESPIPWEERTFGEDGGFFGAKVKETRYVHDPEEGPPFPGVFQVFSLRGGGRTSADELLDFTRARVEEAIEAEGIETDPGRAMEGERELRSGMDTKWFLEEGTIASGEGTFFDPETTITVRILGEAGYDGRSSTGVVVVAYIKVAEEQQSGVPGLPPETVKDERTWFDAVADPDGSIDGATFGDADRGLIYNLRTHD